MARVVLLVPTSSYRAGDFVEAARRLGVELVVASEEPHVMGEVMGPRSLVVDLDDPEAAAATVVAHDALAPVDAVVAVDDRGTVVAGEAARRLGLRHNPLDALLATRDKLQMRRLWAAAEVPQPAFSEIPATADDDAVVALAAAVGFPCVVKPTGLSASQGVLRVDDPAAVADTVRRVRRIAEGAGMSAAAPLLVERYVAGAEVAVECLLSEGRLRVLAVFDKPDPLEGPAFQETLYVTPSRLAPEDRRNVLSAVAAAVRSLGLTEGPVHAEARVESGRVAMIEVAARTIGGLCGRALAFGGGRSLEELVLAQALGWPVADDGEAAAGGVLMVPIPRAGTLVAVDGVEYAASVPGVTAVDITVVPGRRLAPPPEGDRYLGFVFASGDSPQAVERALRTAQARLDVRIDASG